MQLLQPLQTTWQPPFSQDCVTVTAAVVHAWFPSLLPLTQTLISIKCFVSFDLPAAVNRDLELRIKSRILFLRAVWLRLVLRPAGHLSH